MLKLIFQEAPYFKCRDLKIPAFFVREHFWKPPAIPLSGQVSFLRKLKKTGLNLFGSSIEVLQYFLFQ